MPLPRTLPPHRRSNDLLAPDAVMPVVGDGVGWENRKPARREFAFDDIGSRQTGMRKNGARYLGSPRAALTSEIPQGSSLCVKTHVRPFMWLGAPHF
jgi:hypothetical protein